jgi:cytochrome P450/alkylhydroperoxidase family enzyme
VTTTEALGSWGSFDVDDPFPLFAEVRKLGAVHQVTLADGHDAWLVVGYEEAMAALNDPRLSKDMHAALASGSDVVAEGLPGPDFARHMLTVDPPDHTRLRRLVSSAFSPRRVQALAPRVQVLTDDLLDRIAVQDPSRPVDLVSNFAFPLPFTVICELLGVPQADRAQLGREFSELLVPTTTAEEYAEAKKASDAVVAMLEGLVAAKEKDPGDDLVSALISARDGEERLSSQELLSTIFQLMVAGHDTTASLIGNSMAALLRNPQQLSALRSNPGKIPAAIEEFLRYDAPVPHSTFRYSVEPVVIAGVTIPTGAQVIICMAAANRDEARYADPESLDVDRSVTRHLAFGHGVHYCLGAPLARLEGRVGLESILRRFPHLTLAVSSESLRWGHGDGLVLRGLSELPVIPGPARPRAEATWSPSGVAATASEASEASEAGQAREARDQQTFATGFLSAPPPMPGAERLFEQDLEGLGYVMNTSRLWAHLPVALQGFSDLVGEVTHASRLSFAQRAVLVTAAAAARGDSYCSMAWGKKLAEATNPDVAASVIGGGTDGLDDTEAALARWARLVVGDPNAILADDVQPLRDVGFDDSQIFAITAFVGLRLAFSTINDALGALPDSELRVALPGPVRSAVTFGRLADAGET